MRRLKRKLTKTNPEEYEVCVMCGAITNGSHPSTHCTLQGTAELNGEKYACR